MTTPNLDPHHAVLIPADELEQLRLNDARYRWLRDTKAYVAVHQHYRQLPLLDRTGWTIRMVSGNDDRNRHSICFAAEYTGTFYASAIWSSPVAGDLLTKGEYWLELRRFAIANDAPKNTASRMLAVMVRLIRRRFPEIVRLVSYQDTEAHAGTIYKASGRHQGKVVTDTNWGLRRSPTGRKRNAVVATGIKIRWELVL